MFFITAVGEDDTRCVGYFPNLQEAIDTVENNYCDLYEAGGYPYVIIEEIPAGLYQYDLDPLWFEYDEMLDKYKKSSRPEFIQNNSVGFGIG